VFLVLSPDEESSQKFIPFVGVSTSLVGLLPYPRHSSRVAGFTCMGNDQSAKLFFITSGFALT